MLARDELTDTMHTVVLARPARQSTPRSRSGALSAPPAGVNLLQP
jgi:hypothetical protein